MNKNWSAGHPISRMAEGITGLLAETVERGNLH